MGLMTNWLQKIFAEGMFTIFFTAPNLALLCAQGLRAILNM